MIKILNNAFKAIKEEIFLYPCLGLVSKKNSGCHKDMNYKTFLKSYKVLKAYLRNIYNNQNNITSFSDLNKIGIIYEQLMFKATNNINTHKGLIFAFGIFFYCYISRSSDEQEVLNKYISNFCKSLKQLDYNKINSIGAKLYIKHNVKSARHIAVEGYKVVFEILEFYKSNIANLKISQRYKNYFLLLKCVLAIEDTTLINKVGYDKYLNLKFEIQKNFDLIYTNNYDDMFYKTIYNFNNYAIKNNISPGGAADIFVILLFLIKEKY
ncbi:triphosphoribosyl-dephospho-CoA synthase [Spiroplasma helicoides]|uniref:triphosphoribosyl-dephospho-CoA synthase n=1 Tax=Spiroplasma helicoides TaxID=216938 RepID=A0A1B3SM52_9MOLU|nr:triphosphoribosyl-dephospho-CoA synthase [Spiroplasma helicoides]AOG60990.1 triphosphoribosyl-dephospho-CoA synthase [Spiroplasma helicoides]